MFSPPCIFLFPFPMQLEFYHLSTRRQREFVECDLEALDEPCHKHEIERVDRVAGKVVVQISKKSRIRHHQSR